MVTCAVCGKEVSDTDECCGFSPVVYVGEDHEDENNQGHSVLCPDCGTWQGDMGYHVSCEECGGGPMPTAMDYAEDE